MARPRKELPRHERYGRLTVLQAVFVLEGKSKTKFRCDCGKITEKVNDDVVRGKTQSCGCLYQEKEVAIPCRQTIH